MASIAAATRLEVGRSLTCHSATLQAAARVEFMVVPGAVTGVWWASGWQGGGGATLPARWPGGSWRGRDAAGAARVRHQVRQQAPAAGPGAAVVPSVVGGGGGAA